jgi:hypothetical protein
MRSAFGIEHGEVSKALGMPKGLRQATGRGQGGYSTSFVGNRKSAHYVGRILARSKAKGVNIDPHVGVKYRTKSRDLVEQATQRPRKKKELP